MSQQHRLRRIVFLTLAAFAGAALLAADVTRAGAPQNASSSMTMQGQSDNTGATSMRRSTNRRRRIRRNRRRAVTPADTTTATDATTTETTTTDATTGGDATDTAQTIDTANTGGGTQADLSGTYEGNLTLTGGHEMSGPATLTITGNSFTLSSGAMTHSGSFLAINTRGYVGAALYFSDVTDPATNTPLAVSVRARQTGTRLTLTPSPGARNRMTFTSGGATGGRRTRANRRAPATDATNMNTGEATNTNTTPTR